MKKGLMSKIESRGYWKINFKPVSAGEEIRTLGQCKKIINDNWVQLRGWHYPHFSKEGQGDSGLEPKGEYFQGWADLGVHKEIWRFYKNKDFLHYRAMTEDWFEKDTKYRAQAQKVKPREVLGVYELTNLITEIVEFLRNLIKEGIYEKGVIVDISLNNTKNRKLWIDHRDRVPFTKSYFTKNNKIIIKKQLTKEKIWNEPVKLIMEILDRIFDNFGWKNPPLETIEEDVRYILAARI